MKKKNHFKIALLLLVLSSVFACSKLNKVTDVITKPSAREVYKREFKERPAVFSRWNAEFTRTQNDSLQVNLPYAEVGHFTSQLSQVYAYEVSLQNGTIFTAEVEKDSLGYRVFIDIFQQQGSALKHLESNQPEENTINFQPKQTGTYKIINVCITFT